MVAQFVDPTLAQASGSGALVQAVPAAGSSVLAQIAQDFRAQRKKLELDVPDRPGYLVHYDPTVAWELYKAWTVQATDLTGVDQLELATLALVSQCTAISKDGTVLQGDDGKPLTFTDKALQDALGAIDPTSLVRRFYGSDGVVLRAATKLLTVAGYGADSDPTNR